ncbi:MAG: formylmethanofuran dehydrogenase subunit A [Gammaproteobacteria bacterium]|nr:formylmethanofuran dehydrogenase subunit A [Gammaproteobacteria bacterium]
MLIKLAGGTVYDPAQGVDGEVKDLFIRDGRLVSPPSADTKIGREYDLNGQVVMTGGIDMHTHIGGGKSNLARGMLARDAHADEWGAGAPLPDPDHTSTYDTSSDRSPASQSKSSISRAVPPAPVAGYRYAEMGYTTCFEPAVVPINARHAHMEMADTPLVDTGGYAILGNDDFLLRLLADGAEQDVINDYVAWTLNATQCIGIKVVNAGGINAFKYNARKLDLDEQSPHYGVRPRDIIRCLSRAITELGIPHPLHVHTSNLGIPGNIASTLATIDAAEGHRIHLTHVQFHSYGTEGDRKFSSAAAQVTDAVNTHHNVTVDVGQVMFGQTVTLSADTMHQHAAHGHAHPKKWVCMDMECEAGCGIVPFEYKDQNFVNALQWAIGLETFLMVSDPWRVGLTTDHPNGAPFTSYPHLIRLLMDRSFRADMLTSIHPSAAAMSQVGSLAREYSLYEIAIMTRAAPARLLGLEDRGRLTPGAAADVAVYRPHKNRERMFERPSLVFKDGELVVKDGQVVKAPRGRTHVVRPDFDTGIERRLGAWFDECHTVKMGNYKISADEMADHIGSEVVVHPCGARR